MSTTTVVLTTGNLNSITQPAANANCTLNNGAEPWLGPFKCGTLVMVLDITGNKQVVGKIERIMGSVVQLSDAHCVEDEEDDGKFRPCSRHYAIAVNISIMVHATSMSDKDGTYYTVD